MGKNMRDKLLHILDGTTAQVWMARADLLAKTGSTEQELDAALEALYASRQINRSKIIRGDLEIDAIWITGVVAKCSYSGFTISPKKRPLSGQLAWPDLTVKTEKPMQSETKQPENGKSVQQQVLNIIILEPGVTPDSIRKRFADKKLRAAADSAIYALRKAGRIERREEGGKVRLHPTAQAANKNSRRAPVKSARSALPAKLLTGEAAKTLQQSENRPKGYPSPPYYLVCVGFEAFPTLEDARTAAEAMLIHQSSVIIAAPLQIAERTVTWKTAA